MADNRRFPTHVEDFVLWQERKRSEEEDDRGTNTLVRKVTLRIALNQHVALKLLAHRYGISVTALGEKLLESAALDAADLAGITVDQLNEGVLAEVNALDSSLRSRSHATTEDFLTTLKDHDMALSGISEAGS